MQKEPVNILKQERYRVLIDHAPQPMLILDVESEKIIDFNDQAELFFNLPGSKLRNLNPADLGPKQEDEENIPLHSCGLIRKALDGDNSIFPWVYQDREGKEHHCEVWLVRFPPFDRKLLSATIIDKTQNRQMEQALAESEELKKLTLQTTDLGSFDWSFESGDIDWDDKMYELHGLDRNADVDKTAYLFSILHPEDLKWIQARLGQITQPGDDFTSFGNEYRIIKNGQIHFIQVNGSFFRDKSGKIYRVFGTTRDITTKKQTEEKLHYQAALLENVSDAVISTDADFLIKSWNRAAEKLYGWKPEEMIGQNIFNIPTDYQEQSESEVLAKFKQEGFWKGEVIQENRAGHPFYVLTSVVTLKDQYGNPTGYVAVNRDISKEKEIEIQKIRSRQLELKNKEMEQFTYAVSHDLQEPLHTVQGFVNLLRKRFYDNLDERSAEYIELINQSIHRMNNLIRALLDYSRIGLYEERSDVNAEVLVQELLNDLSAQIRTTGAKVQFEHLPTLRGYETELRVLFQNLVSNAIKFHNGKVAPEVLITARETEKAWEFCIADNGIGISPKHQQRIFAIFQRLHPISDYPGTGIGLSHCQKIIELHGGDIWVESSPDRGSKFFFTIPK